jgi:uncharacterized lipoprotein YmbA
MKVVILLLVTLFTLMACSNTSLTAGNATRFYSLNSLAPSTVSGKNLRIGVGPLEIPRLINRPQIVSRKDNIEINMAENHQWGGSHKEEIIQVITDNLSSLLRTESIEQYPWKFSFKPRYQVRINIERFDGELGKNITLRARWRLIQNNKEILVKRALITTRTKGNSYNAYVKAQSEALKVLSQQITQQIKAAR